MNKITSVEELEKISAQCEESMEVKLKEYSNIDFIRIVHE